MRENFDNELKRAEEISKYNKTRAYSMLDDMATAYISVGEYGHLDMALIAIRQAKKALRASGHNSDFIQDYFLQRSYLSKTTLRQLRNESIYTGDSVSIRPEIINRVAHHNDKTTTDLIIDTLQSRPELLSCLQRGVSKQYLAKKFNVTQPETLKQFYNKYKDIIDN